jgi:2,3-bisphosphoglycerate-independent phosphoglycerate mutase
LPARFLVAPPEIEGTLSERLAARGVPQLAISETQKYGHVTYFWNGNRSERLSGESWIEIPSDALPFDERPWMKAAEITDRLIAELRTGRYRFARVNYANGDMVGHTGVLDAARVAVEAVDLSLGRLVRAVTALDGALLVTADHGNADEMVERDKKGNLQRGEGGRFKPKTSHSLNRVPCHLVGAPAGVGLRSDEEAGLANVAATVLDLLGEPVPAAYERSLLVR